jgi:hypothetical protein
MPENRPETTAGATAAGATAAPAAEPAEPAEPGEPGEPAPAGDAAGRTGRASDIRTWWLVAPAFVLGLFAGAVTLGLLREDPPPVPATATEAPAGSGDSSGSDGPAPGASAEFTVNEACLRVVNETQDLVGIVGDLGDAAADLDISGLDDAIRRLQPLEGRLRKDLAACETDTALPDGLSPLPGDEEPAGSPAAPSTAGTSD